MPWASGVDFGPGGSVEVGGDHFGRPIEFHDGEYPAGLAPAFGELFVLVEAFRLDDEEGVFGPGFSHHRRAPGGDDVSRREGVVHGGWDGFQVLILDQAAESK